MAPGDHVRPVLRGEAHPWIGEDVGDGHEPAFPEGDRCDAGARGHPDAEPSGLLGLPGRRDADEPIGVGLQAIEVRHARAEQRHHRRDEPAGHLPEIQTAREVAPDLGQGPRGLLRELALGDVGDRGDDRGLAGESQALGGQQRVTDFAGALPEAHLDISHGALLFQEPDDLVALLERHPEAEVTDRPPDHLLSAESEKAGELLVHVQHPALVKRAHAHGLRARVKDDGEPFLRAAQLLPGRFEEVGHAGGGGLSRPPFMVPGADVGSHDWTDRHFGGQFGGGESAMVSGAVREPDRGSRRHATTCRRSPMRGGEAPRLVSSAADATGRASPPRAPASPRAADR